MRTRLDDLRGKKVLLVASTGGHLFQLTRLAPRLGLSPDSEWVTFDTPQSRSLLKGKVVHHVPYVAPRDWKNIVRAHHQTRNLRHDFDATLSTGAGLALAILPAMALRGRKTVFIESISRVQGPSMTGRMLSRLPHIGMYSQHPYDADPWLQGPSVLSTYRADPPAEGAETRLPQRIYVTLGTIKPYRFDRLVDLVKGYVTAHPGTEVRWQLGCSDRDDLPGEVHAEMSSEAFCDSIGWADLVVAHSGVGVAMNILDAGRMPVLLARDPAKGEHVDTHQQQIFHYLVERNLAADAEVVFRDDEALARTAAVTISTIDDELTNEASEEPMDDQSTDVKNRRLVAVTTAVTEPLRNVLRPVHRQIAGSLPLYWRRQYLFAAAMFRPGNFTDPKTFSEKINWRIINDRRPQLVRACDKLEMKAMARERVSDPNRLRVPETWWTGTDVDDIPEELLAREAILKPNDGSGDVVFLPASREDLREKTKGWLTGEQSDRLGEWGYSKAQHVMLIEEKIPFDDDLPDYKFKVFDGKPLVLEVHTGRFSGHRCTYFDQDFKQFDVETTYLPASPDVARPEHLDEMFAMAAELGQGWDFIRVDFYVADGQVWFGEFSPYPGGGVSRFAPNSFDEWMGSEWPLPSLDEVRG